MMPPVQWQQGSDTMVLDEQHLHLWRCELNATEQQLADDYHLLDQHEQQRACRFHFDRHRHRFIIAHAFLRRVLAAYVDASPEALVFCKGSHGKPSLDGHALEFNLTHSETLAVLGVCRSQPIGVDVEYCQQRSSAPLALAERFFTPQEVAQLRATNNDAELQQRFFQLWTAKEAVVKANGKGLSQSLSSFSVDLEKGQADFLQDAQAPSLKIMHCVPEENYICSVAMEQLPAIVSHYYATKAHTNR